MAKTPILPTQSPLSFYSPIKQLDLSTLAMAIGGLEVKGTDLVLNEGDPYLKDIIPDSVADALDVFILMKRGVPPGEIVEKLHLSQPTYSRRVAILREMACTTVVF